MKNWERPRMVTCPSCHGEGVCRRCLGTGHDPVFGYRGRCILCNGSRQCLRCDGTGLVHKEQIGWGRRAPDPRESSAPSGCGGPQGQVRSHLPRAPHSRGG